MPIVPNERAIDLAKLVRHPEALSFAMGWRVYDAQRPILRAVATQSRTAVRSGNENGKCVPAGTPILLADGSTLLARDLPGLGVPFELPTLCDGATVPTRARAADNGLARVRELTLDNGARVARTLNHRLWTPGGWTPVAEINPDDPVAVPIQIDAWPESTLWTDRDIDTAAMIGAKKGKTEQTAPRWYLTHAQALRFVARLLARFRAYPRDGSRFHIARTPYFGRALLNLLSRLGATGALVGDRPARARSLDLQRTVVTLEPYAIGELLALGLDPELAGIYPDQLGYFARALEEYERPTSGAPLGCMWRRVTAAKTHPDAVQTIAIETDAHTYVSPQLYEHNSTLASVLGVSHLLSHPDNGVVILVGPSAQQLARVLWGYVRRIADKLFEMGLHAPKPTRSVGSLVWEITPSNYMLGLSTDTSERISGYHAPDGLLVIVDEASHLTQTFHESIFGLGGRVLYIGNSLWTGGVFYECFHKQRHLWSTHHLEAIMTPNFDGVESYEQVLTMTEEELDVRPAPGLADRRFVRDAILGWGYDSPLFEVRIRGEFPSQRDDAMFPLPWLERARDPINAAFDGLRLVGIDVAGPGRDKTAMVTIEGWNITDTWTTEQANSLAFVMEKLNTEYNKSSTRIAVDAGGIGWNFYLAVAAEGWHVEPVNFHQDAADKSRFVYWNDETAWRIREALEQSMIGQLPEPLIGQMATIHYEPTLRGLVTLEPKAKRKKRGLASPDLFDAFMLACHLAFGSGFSFAFPPRPEFDAVQDFFTSGFDDD